MYYLGITISVFANILFFKSIMVDDKNKMFVYQSFETFLNTIKNILLGGFSGASTQFIGLIRNSLLAKGYGINVFILTLMCILQMVIGYFVNNYGLIGYLPIIASVSYTIINFATNDVVTSKVSLFLNILLWTIYDYVIKDYVSLVTSIIAMILIMNSIYKIKKE